MVPNMPKHVSLQEFFEKNFFFTFLQRREVFIRRDFTQKIAKKFHKFEKTFLLKMVRNMSKHVTLKEFFEIKFFFACLQRREDFISRDFTLKIFHISTFNVATLGLNYSWLESIWGCRFLPADSHRTFVLNWWS